MITTQALRDAGYVEFIDPSADDALRPYYRRSYQKWISDPLGKCYALTIRHGIWPKRPAHDETPFFAPSVQFRRGSTTFNVAMLHHEETLVEIEAFFAEVWTKLGADYYEGFGQ